MTLPNLLVKSHILEYEAHKTKPPLKVVAEAYTIDGNANAKTRNAEGLTLILTTGIGAGTVLVLSLKKKERREVLIETLSF